MKQAYENKKKNESKPSQNDSKSKEEHKSLSKNEEITKKMEYTSIPTITIENADSDKESESSPKIKKRKLEDSDSEKKKKKKESKEGRRLNKQVVELNDYIYLPKPNKESKKDSKDGTKKEVIIPRTKDNVSFCWNPRYNYVVLYTYSHGGKPNLEKDYSNVKDAIKQYIIELQKKDVLTQHEESALTQLTEIDKHGESKYDEYFNIHKKHFTNPRNKNVVSDDSENSYYYNYLVKEMEYYAAKANLKLCYMKEKARKVKDLSSDKISGFIEKIFNEK